MQVHEADRKVALVLGVARLGEAGLQGWWRSHGLDQAGTYVLRGAFPRTWRASALELDLLSAARRHAQILPRPTALHLFSDGLPFRRLAAAWLAEQKAKPDAALTDVLCRWSVESAREELAEWAGRTTYGGGRLVGPAICLGNLNAASLESDDVLEQICSDLAAAYLRLNGSFHPPYYESA